MDEDVKKAEFLSFCIENYKEREGEISGTKMADLFEERGALDFLSENYDLLHTIGKEQLKNAFYSSGKRNVIPKITQKNVFIFIPFKAAEIAVALSKDCEIPLKSALLMFYHSSVYQLLEQEKTKLWHQSAMQIYANYFLKGKQ